MSDILSDDYPGAPGPSPCAACGCRGGCGCAEARQQEREASAPLYTTWGSVRGCCGHAHRSLAAAERCLRADQSGSYRAGGYSDRAVRVLEHAGEAQAYEYDVTRGPGRALPWDDDEGGAL